MNLELRELFPTDPDRLFRRGFVLSALRHMDLRASRLLGQNFLYQRPTLEACLDEAEVSGGQCILEIGPGLGHLSTALAVRGCHVVTVEIDSRLAHYMRVLAETYSSVFPGRLRPIHADALRVPWDGVLGEFADCLPKDGEIRVVSNLPYRTAIPIVMRLLEAGLPLADLHVLVQMEIGSRLAAEPRQKDYGRVSVISQCLCDIRILRRLSPGNFFPRPKVASAWVRLKRIPDADTDLIWVWMKSIVGAAFTRRRKQLKWLASEWIPPGRSTTAPETVRAAFGERLSCRPEELDIATWSWIAARLRDDLGTGSGVQSGV